MSIPHGWCRSACGVGGGHGKERGDLMGMREWEERRWPLCGGDERGGRAIEKWTCGGEGLGE